MPKSFGGNRYSFLFVEARTGILVAFPMRDKTLASCPAAIEQLEKLVRRMFPGVELTTLILDSDPTWTKTNPTSSLAGTRNVAAMDAWIAEGRPHLRIKHSPPHTRALNCHCS